MDGEVSSDLEYQLAKIQKRRPAGPGL